MSKTDECGHGWLIERYINNRLHFWNAGALSHGRRDGFTRSYAARTLARASLLWLRGGNGRPRRFVIVCVTNAANMMAMAIVVNGKSNVYDGKTIVGG